MKTSNKLVTLEKLDSLLPPALQICFWDLKPQMDSAESVGDELCLPQNTGQDFLYNCISSQQGKLSFWVSAVLASAASSVLSVLHILFVFSSLLVPVSDHEP